MVTGCRKAAATWNLRIYDEIRLMGGNLVSGRPV